jgi:hypothetical protein
LWLIWALGFGQNEVKVAPVTLEISQGLFGSGLPDLPVFISGNVAMLGIRIFFSVNEVDVSQRSAVSIASAISYKGETERQLTDPTILAED